MKNDYLKIAIKACKEGIKILDYYSVRKINYKFDKIVKKEIKTNVDTLIEKKIMSLLSKTNIPILSEEINDINYLKNNDLLWVLDPLDGTYNYLRKINSCAISIALLKNNKPILGVIGEYPSKKIIWGGKKIGSFENNKKIKVSSFKSFDKSVLCTGFPVRYKFTKNKITKLFKKFNRYGKIRMLGSATISLTKLAKGSVDAYEEENIMIWDVAAGLAIVEGAGGKYSITKGKFTNSVLVKANNSYLK